MYIKANMFNFLWHIATSTSLLCTFDYFLMVYSVQQVSYAPKARLRREREQLSIKAITTKMSA